MIEVELHSHLAVACLHHIRLSLGNQSLIMSGGKARSLFGVQVHICGLQTRGEVGRRQAASRAAVLDDCVRVRRDDALFEAFELDMNLNSMELK